MALNKKTKRAAKATELGHVDESQLRASHAEIAETERDVVSAELSKQPSALSIGYSFSMRQGM
jgi:hypothetical protein